MWLTPCRFSMNGILSPFKLFGNCGSNKLSLDKIKFLIYFILLPPPKATCYVFFCHVSSYIIYFLFKNKYINKKLSHVLTTTHFKLYIFYLILVSKVNESHSLRRKEQYLKYREWLSSKKKYIYVDGDFLEKKYWFGT